MAEDLSRSSNRDLLHYLHQVARQDNTRSGRDEYLRTSDCGLWGLSRYTAEKGASGESRTLRDSYCAEKYF